jgi:hypothetical protein
VIVVNLTSEKLDILQKVFQRFRGTHLKPNLEECQLFQKEVRYLGYIVSPGRVTAEPEKLTAVREWPSRKTNTS